jgi:two-component system, NtrC family, sensor kinase
VRLSLKISAVAALGVALALLADGYVRGAREQARLAAQVERDHRAFAQALATAAGAAAERDGAQHARKLLEDVDARETGVDIYWEPEKQGRRAGTQMELTVSGGVSTSRVPLWLDGPGQLVLHRERAAEREESALLETDAVRAAAALALLATLIIFATALWLVGLPLQLLVVQARQIGGAALVRGQGIKSSGELGELAGGMHGLRLQLARVRAEVSKLSAERSAATERLCEADRGAALGRVAAGLIPAFVARLAAVEARAASLASGRVPERARGDAQQVCEEATDLAVALRPLLAYSEPRSASVPRPARDLRRLVTNVAELLSGVAGERGVALCVASDSEAVAAPVCSAQIQHLLMALALNSIDAQPEGGSVRLAAHSNCRPYLPYGLNVGANGYVCLVVDDEGLGMTPEVRERMFEPFFTTRRVGEGNGLGLPAVALIVEDHRGFIRVETAPRAGTRMTIFIPR